MIKMAQLTEIQQTIAKQIGAKELRFAKFTLMTEGTHSVVVHKGKKSLKITYDEGSDTYTVSKYKMCEFIKGKAPEVITDVYFDDLRPLITGFFPHFEYCMEGLRILEVNY